MQSLWGEIDLRAPAVVAKIGVFRRDVFRIDPISYGNVAGWVAGWIKTTKPILKLF